MRLKTVYNMLFRAYGPQHWWPGDTPFEIMVGAVLTQNTTWSNVEKAIANLKGAQVLSAEAIVAAHPKKLASWLKPSGYFNIKARRVKNFLSFLNKKYRGSLRELFRLKTPALREKLLGVNGIGPETADSIILYAAGRPVFVVDAYTKRLCGLCGVKFAKYDQYRAFFESRLPRSARLYNEFHALIVRIAKEHCRTKPDCRFCPLK